MPDKNRNSERRCAAENCGHPSGRTCEYRSMRRRRRIGRCDLLRKVDGNPIEDGASILTLGRTADLETFLGMGKEGSGVGSEIR